MNRLFELYGFGYPMKWPGISGQSRFELGGCNVRDDGNHATVHRRYLILRAIPGCAVQGVQDSSDWILGACATRLRRRVDTCTAGTRSTSHSRCVRGRARLNNREGDSMRSNEYPENN